MYLDSARETKHRLFSHGRRIQYLLRLCPYHHFYPLGAFSEKSPLGTPVEGEERN